MTFSSRRFAGSSDCELLVDWLRATRPRQRVTDYPSVIGIPTTLEQKVTLRKYITIGCGQSNRASFVYGEPIYRAPEVRAIPLERRRSSQRATRPSLDRAAADRVDRLVPVYLDMVTSIRMPH